MAAGDWRRGQSDFERNAAKDYDISRLELKMLTDVEEGSCAVCQCDWEVDDEVRILPCTHQFHTVCVDKWLRNHKASCPLCKKGVREDREDVEEEVWDPVPDTWKSVHLVPDK